MNRRLPLFIGLSLGLVSLFGHTEDLIQVYQQAKQSNPDLRRASAERDSAFEKINESRGSLLPQLNATAGYSANQGRRDNSGINNNSTSANLQLSQTLFDLSIWQQLSLTEKQASVQDVTLKAAEQSLMLNTATAYFNVLRAIDSLTFTEANKQAVYKQLDQVTQQFNVGLTAITDVQNAKAQYDQVLANEVIARNNLNNALENLRQISGTYYPALNALNVEHFKTEQQGAIDPLLEEAEKQNLDLLAARLAQELSREQIRLAQSGHLPTVNLTASTGVQNTNNTGRNNPQSDVNSGQSTVGVNLNLPIYRGGITNSQVKQAQFNFVGSSEALESAYRNVVNRLRSSYNNTQASISTISALQQAVVSTQSSLDATEAGYQVGTRTIVDVLNATTALYNAKQQLSGARYDYLINRLNVRSALGTLSQDDLAKLNTELGKPVSTQPIVTSAGGR